VPRPWRSRCLGHRLAEPVGIADGEHDIADPQRVGSTHGMTGRLPIDRRKIARWYRVLADHGCLGDAPIRSCTRIESAPAITCWLVTMVPLESTMTRIPSCAHVLAVARPIVTEQLVERRGLPPFRDHPRRVNVHHGGAARAPSRRSFA